MVTVSLSRIEEINLKIKIMHVKKKLLWIVTG